MFSGAKSINDGVKREKKSNEPVLFRGEVARESTM
jgi:hypothetical protein